MNHKLTTSTLAITLPGDVLSTTISPLRAEFLRLMESPPVQDSKWSILEINLAAARMVDSAGLNFLVALIKAAKNRGATVRALVSSRTVHRTFVFTRLDKQVELVLLEEGAKTAA
jgi:anti-anti-sigma regulatory factor